MSVVLTADASRQWVTCVRAALAARRGDIDALNVFPVPDGDTGTNVFLTIDRAIDDVDSQTDAASEPLALTEGLSTFARAVLMSARGNSGVIVSQIVAGLSAVAVEGDLDELDAQALAMALTRGSELARRSVAHPQEGTILTVADAAAAAAEREAAAGADATSVVAAALTEARAALDRTPDQLPALARAGVVDAGGAALVVVLAALHRTLSGQWTPEGDALPDFGAPPSAGSASPPPGPDPGADVHADETRDHTGEPQGEPAAARHSPTDAPPGVDGPAFEVMFLLDESDDDAVAVMTSALDGLGDSLLVVGGPDLWNVHVHVDDVGAAIEAAIVAGRPHRIQVTHFATQIAAREPAGFAVVACAAGPGMVSLLEEAGATAVPSGPGARASAGQLLDAIRATRASSVAVLPNDKDTFMAAQVACKAADDEGITTALVPARTAVQGLAALAVVDPAQGLRANAIAMTSAAGATRHGAVTVASRAVLTWAGPVEIGDVLGIVSGDVAFIGSDVADAAYDVVCRLLTSGGELITLVTGAQADSAMIDALEARLAKSHAEIEVVRIDGGQAVYPLLIGVE